MRLALGFCGHVAKTAFSSLSGRKVGVGNRIEVKLRQTVCCCAVSQSLCLFVSAGGFHAYRSLNRLACRLPKCFSALKLANGLRRCHSGTPRNCITFCTLLHLIFSASHISLKEEEEEATAAAAAAMATRQFA